jgi:[ribosomal protein S18]-alanine N-acetyltransferase
MIVAWLKNRFGARPARTGPLRPGDAPALARIHAEAFARPWDAHDLERMLTDPAMVADGIFMGASARPLGFALSRQVLDEAEILTIAVTRRVQWRGFGRTLLAAHLAHLAANGAKILFLEVEETNTPAIALYRRFGFSDAGRREGYYQRADTSRAALVLRRSL